MTASLSQQRRRRRAKGSERHGRPLADAAEAPLPEGLELLGLCRRSSLAVQALLHSRAAVAWFADDDPWIARLVQAVGLLARHEHGNFVTTQLWLLASSKHRADLLAATLAELPELARNVFGCRLVYCMLEGCEGGVVLRRLLADGPLHELLLDAYGQYVVQACVLWHPEQPEVCALREACLSLAGESDTWRHLAVAVVEHAKLSPAMLRAAAYDAATVRGLFKLKGPHGDILRRALHGVLQREPEQDCAPAAPACAPAAPASGWQLRAYALCSRPGAPPCWWPVYQLCPAPAGTTGRLQWALPARQLRLLGLNVGHLMCEPRDVGGARFRLCLQEMRGGDSGRSRREALHGPLQLAVLAQLRCDVPVAVELGHAGTLRRHCFARQPSAFFVLAVDSDCAEFAVDVKLL